MDNLNKARNTRYEEVRIGLTSRQKEIVRRKKNSTYEEIAKDLGISDRTAEKHYQNATNTVEDYPDYLRQMIADLVILNDERKVAEMAEILEHASADFENIDISIE